MKKKEVIKLIIKYFLAMVIPAFLVFFTYYLVNPYKQTQKDKTIQDKYSRIEVIEVEHQPDINSLKTIEVEDIDSDISVDVEPDIELESEPENIMISDNSISPAFDNLNNQNSDLVGWVKINNTKINLPVYQRKSNPNYYLTHDRYGNKSKYGEIYLDGNCSIENNPSIFVLYGHHITGGLRFSEICNYKNLSYYKSRPVIEFDTLYESSDWKIISFFRTNTLSEHGEVFNYARSNFVSNSDYQNYLNEITARSEIITGVDVNTSDQLVLLSTCSYEYEDFRTVLVARKVRNGESSTVNTANAKQNPNPTRPDVWRK